MSANCINSTKFEAKRVAEQPTAAERPTTTALLSELAYVLHLTRSVKQAILEEQDCPAVVSA